LPPAVKTDVQQRCQEYLQHAKVLRVRSFSAEVALKASEILRATADEPSKLAIADRACTDFIKAGPKLPVLLTYSANGSGPSFENISIGAFGVVDITFRVSQKAEKVTSTICVEKE
jgi:hypothetical protein